MKYDLNYCVTFKRHRQYAELALVDRRLLVPFLSTAAAFFLHSGKPLLVTGIIRTPDENAAVGGQPTSGHMADPPRAIDVRTKAIEGYPGINSDQADWIIDFWTRNFRKGRYWSCIDEGDHLHFQVPARPGY